MSASPFTKPDSLSFVVYGKPQPQGSAKAFYNKRLGRAIITSDNTKLKPFRQEVTGMALATMDGRDKPMASEGTPVQVEVDFYFAKPKSAKKRLSPSVKPDIDKLLRAILDSLTGIAFHDDAQVVDAHARKHYGDTELTSIIVRAI